MVAVSVAISEAVVATTWEVAATLAAAAAAILNTVAAEVVEATSNMAAAILAEGMEAVEDSAEATVDLEEALVEEATKTGVAINESGSCQFWEENGSFLWRSSIGFPTFIRIVVEKENLDSFVKFLFSFFRFNR